jgi:CelD/BcsL family acetyltransferase involved in cellulose biosynthesis
MKRRSSSIAVLGRAPAVSRLRVETVGDYQSFLALEPAWNRLMERAGVEHPFLEFEWARTWWESFGGGKRLFLLLVWDGGELRAIAPLLLNRQRMYGLKLRQLELFHNDQAGRLDFLVAQPDAEVYGAIWQHLAELDGVWDAIKLCQVPADSPTLEQWNSLARADGLLTGVWRSSNTPCLSLEGNWERYLAGLRSAQRSELGRRERRLAELGPLELEVVCAPDQVAAAIEEAMPMQAAEWRVKARAGIGRPAQVRRFYATLAGRFSARGRLRLCFLRLNEKRIAFGFGVSCANRLYLLRSGCDARYASYAPSSVLLSRLIRRSFDSGLAAIELPGEDGGNLEWTRESRPHYWIFVFRHSVRDSLLRQARFRLAMLRDGQLTEDAEPVAA